MTRLILLASVILTALAALPARGGQPVVVELFTSQGCSACPPADALLSELAREDGVIALSLHVDYWDYLGWRDRFGRPENTRRQKAYAQAAGARSIYTPQAVVQGRTLLVGSDRSGIRAAIARIHSEPARARLELTQLDDRIEVRVSPVGKTEFKNHGVLHLVLFDRPQRVTIQNGENSGKTITYTNVVRDWMRLGYWSGEAEQVYSAPVPSMGKGLAVILQDGLVGPIYAAAVLER